MERKILWRTPWRRIEDNGEDHLVCTRHGGGESLEERYRVVVETRDLLLLRRIGGEDDGVRERALMAGEILDGTTILEVINLIASSRWVGTLHVRGPDSRRSLGFYRGGLRYARSDHPEDRLDKILFRIGMLNPAQVEEAMRDIRPDQRFGELLVERGFLERRQLFGALRRQMEQTLLSTVLVEHGSYLFSVSEDDETPPEASAHLPLQQLLLDAAERVDRLASFRRLVPDLNTRPTVEPGVEVTHLDRRARLVLGYADGERSIEEIASETWLGRFETVATVYELVRNGKVRLRPPERSPQGSAQALVAPFNTSLNDIYRTAEQHDEADRVRREIAMWAEEETDLDLPEKALDGDGLFRVEAIADVLCTADTPHQREAIAQALHQAVSFALFSASLGLPRQEERELARRVHRRLRTAGA